MSCVTLWCVTSSLCAVWWTAGCVPNRALPQLRTHTGSRFSLTFRSDAPQQPAQPAAAKPRPEVISEATFCTAAGGAWPGGAAVGQPGGGARPQQQQPSQAAAAAWAARQKQQQPGFGGGGGAGSSSGGGFGMGSLAAALPPSSASASAAPAAAGLQRAGSGGASRGAEMAQRAAEAARARTAAELARPPTASPALPPHSRSPRWSLSLSESHCSSNEGCRDRDAAAKQVKERASLQATLDNKSLRAMLQDGGAKARNVAS